MSNLGSFTDININGNYLTVKDKVLTEIVEEIIMAIGANNGNISERINNLHERSFDAEIKITSNNDSEISNIIDGLYKLQYVTVTGEGDEAVETLDNSAILIQQGTDQYIYKDGEIIHKIKIDNKWWNSLKEYYTNQYLTIVSLEDNNEIGFKYNSGNTSETISVSTDNGETWTEKSSSSSGTLLATLNANDKLLIKSSDFYYGNSSETYFTSTNDFNVQGNIMSLAYEDNFADKTSFVGYGDIEFNGTRSKNFGYLFSGCTHLISAEHLILPISSKLTSRCYIGLFKNCSNLITPPVELPATTVLGYCYYEMFAGCTSLTTAPKLSATTLADFCYYGMFKGCISLTTAPELPATTLVYACYQEMFYGCTSLTAIPELPATTLAVYCYSGMFEYCTSLTTISELPATTLASGCYRYMFYYCINLKEMKKICATITAGNSCEYMFYGCSSLTTAPELPATTLEAYCYYVMFGGCTSLTTAPELPATTLANYCYFSMFANCTSLTLAPELPATTLATQCYDNMFYGCTSLVKAPILNATSLATRCYQNMFSNCTSLNSITCLASTMDSSDCTAWVTNVQSTGIFIKNDVMNDWATGMHGIPQGWQVYNESDYEFVRHYELSSVSGGVTSFNGQQGEITYTPPVISVNGHQGAITVNELPSTTSSDNGKILMVVNGVWTLTTPSTLYSGTGAPNNENGNNGDIYVQTGEQSNE